MSYNLDPALAAFTDTERAGVGRHALLVAGLVAVAAVVSGCEGGTTTQPGVSVTAPSPLAPSSSDAPAPLHESQQGIPYYLNSTQSVYGNIHAMRNSGKYPSLNEALTALEQEPVATWIGEWLGDTQHMEATVEDITIGAETAKQMPVLVAYNIPDRDLGEYSAGGTQNAALYKEYIAAISRGIGMRNAVVILEPDALPGVPDMPKVAGEARIAMLHDALVTLSNQNPNAHIYLDGGHSRWLEPVELAALLHRVDGGKGLVKGISLNVSNYRPTAELTSYFNEVNSLMGGSLHGFLDVGLNGAPTPPQPDNWCNPREARHTPPPDRIFDVRAPLEHLAVRIFGESSGECDRGDPAAGEFDRDLLATELGHPSGQYAT